MTRSTQSSSSASPTLTYTPTTTDYEEVQRSWASYFAMYSEVMHNKFYYSSLNPDLFNSVKSIESYQSATTAQLYEDELAEYILSELIMSFYSFMPASKNDGFQTTYSSFYSRLSYYGTLRIASITPPYSTTPSSSSWDTSISLPTSGAYSDLYMMAKCKALDADGNDYAGWYNIFISTYESRSFIRSLTYNVVRLSRETGIPIVITNPSAYTRCKKYISLIDVLPWKERVLADAKQRYQSYSSSFTTTIKIQGHTTLIPDHLQSHTNLSKGAKLGVIFGTLLGFFAICVLISWLSMKYSFRNRNSVDRTIGSTYNVPFGSGLGRVREEPISALRPAVASERDDDDAPPPTYQQALTEKAILPHLSTRQ
ncbi:unnamed protein product [Ambrosiozyma monospora]|uniref:Unnamed protein product n=1 Tax=Ambrosiozyma monospora TaxID=43982 RepID=A0ACB5SVC7_AMBMO|nr:unnamed protein product [Ambrosiozyma monospora]